MNESDIKYIEKLLSKSIRTKDWDCVIEALEYIQEYHGEDGLEEEG